MQDMFFIVVFMFTLAFCMRKHGTWKPVDGLGGFLGWFFASFLLFGVTKVLFIVSILFFTGKPLSFPIAATDGLHLLSSVLTVLVWFAMMYWRIPMRLLGRK